MGKHHRSLKCKRSSLHQCCMYVSGLEQRGVHSVPLVCKHTLPLSCLQANTRHTTHIHNKALFSAKLDHMHINLPHIMLISPHQTFSITRSLCLNWLIRFTVDEQTLQNKVDLVPPLTDAVTTSIKPTKLNKISWGRWWTFFTSDSHRPGTSWGEPQHFQGGWDLNCVIRWSITMTDAVTPFWHL